MRREVVLEEINKMLNSFEEDELRNIKGVLHGMLFAKKVMGSEELKKEVGKGEGEK